MTISRIAVHNKHIFPNFLQVKKNAWYLRGTNINVAFISYAVYDDTSPINDVIIAKMLSSTIRIERDLL